MTAALEGYEALEGYVEELLHTLRVVLFLAGCEGPGELRARPRVVTGLTGQWIEQLERADTH